jgi:EAL domain-containing protein (putative c-di-GMP-specific phosphodiesterase class I)
VEVVAEGVETESQRRLLVEASAHAQGQGFYYSRAVSAQESLRLLREGKVGWDQADRIEPHESARGR